ncbi:hypothetical protein Tco_0563752 [Tanacetum coccineum]
MALPEDHLAKFHKMTDAKEIWKAIKSRFGGNDESKKMQKYILKQQFEGFSVSNSEGLHKGYDRFQSLLSQLEIHGAGVSTEDAWNTGNKDKENGRRSGKQEDSKALVTLDGEGVDWTSHSEDEQENYALMACSKGTTWRCQYRNTGIYDALKMLDAQLVSSTKSTLDEETICHDGARDNVDLGYGDQMNKGVLSYEMKFSNEETHESMPEPVVNEPKVVSQPKVWSDAPIIEEYESDSEDEHVFLPTKEQETPSFAFINTVKHVKTPRQTVKEQNTCSQSPDKKDCSGLMAEKQGLGYGFTKKACFVYGSFSHLIRDCDFHEKMMAKQAELNNRMSKGSGQREIRPVWNNVQRVNHQNQFVPKAVLTRTGKIQVNTTRTSGTNTVNTARTSGTNTVNTARHNFNRQAVLTNGARKVNTVKPIVNNARPKASFHKTLSPFRKPFNRTTALRTNFSYQKVNTAEDYPQRALQNKGISVLVLVSGYLKGKPKLGLWYPRVSSFDLEAYSDSDYAGANLDRKSTTGEAEYVAAANCCGQVLWIQNQMDAYEKKLIQVLKIHSDDNIANLLIKAFDDSYLGFIESLERDIDGTEELLLPDLFILWLTKVSTDSAKLIPLGKDSTAIKTLEKIPPRV